MEDINSLNSIHNSALCNDDFNYLATKIIELFPNECKETYFVPPVKKKESRDKKSEISKEKLVDKWRNARTFIRSAEKLGNEVSDDDESPLSAEGEFNLHSDPTNLNLLKYICFCFD